MEKHIEILVDHKEYITKEVLKILGEGDLEKLSDVYEMAYTGGPMELSDVYEMAYTGGPMELRKCGFCEVHRLIRDCHGNDEVIFIKVEK